MATVMTAFPVFDSVVETLRAYVTANLVPAGSSRLITVYMQQFAENAARLRRSASCCWVSRRSC
jgi:penicillin V acylase-like amidase (Ntn superfamily)